MVGNLVAKIKKHELLAFWPRDFGSQKGKRDNDNGDKETYQKGNTGTLMGVREQDRNETIFIRPRWNASDGKIQLTKFRARIVPDGFYNTYRRKAIICGT